MAIMPFETVCLKTVEYLSVPSVVGHEGHFFRYLKYDFEKLGLTAVQHDGILEISGAKPESHIISAHIDRHGLISIGGGKYAYAAQYVKEEKYNEENVPSQKTLHAISDRFEDEIVYAYNPETGDKLGEGVIKDCDPCIANGDAVFFVEGMRNMDENIPIAYARLSESDGEQVKKVEDRTATRKNSSVAASFQTWPSPTRFRPRRSSASRSKAFLYQFQVITLSPCL